MHMASLCHCLESHSIWVISKELVKYSSLYCSQGKDYYRPNLTVRCQAGFEKFHARSTTFSFRWSYTEDYSASATTSGLSLGTPATAMMRSRSTIYSMSTRCSSLFKVCTISHPLICVNVAWSVFRYVLGWFHPLFVQCNFLVVYLLDKLHWSCLAISLISYLPSMQMLQNPHREISGVWMW